MGMTFGGQACQEPSKIAKYLAKDTAFTLIKDWYGQANRFTCPLGDRPGRGLLLLTRDQLETIDIYTNTAFDLIVSDQLRRLTIKDLVPLRAYCVTPGADNDQRRIYALEVADKRFFRWQKFVNKSYNVYRAPDAAVIVDTQNGGTDWTWEEMGEDLWDAIGVTESWPGWPNDPDSGDLGPQSWHFWQVPPIVAFQAVARRQGCSLRYNPFTAAYDLVQLGAPDQAFDESVDAMKARDRLWDEDWLEPWPHQVPETVRVVFRRILAEADGNPYFLEDVAFPDTGISANAVAGTFAQVIDDMIYDGSNGADITARAEDRADDYARLVRYFHNRIYRHYRGVGTVNDLFIGPRCSTIAWQDLGEGVHTIIDNQPLEVIDWSQYLHGIGEVVTAATCVGSNIEETMLSIWGPKPLRFS